MFIAALATTVNRWKQPKCLPSDDRVSKTRYTSMRCDATQPQKKNEVLMHASTQMNPENITLSEGGRARTQKHVLYDSTYLK